MQMLLISLAGGIGALCRYLLGLKLTQRYSNANIPVTIVIVNLLGSLGLGVFYGLYFNLIPIHPYNDLPFLIIGVGFFGAFTTFSTFSMEAVELIRKKAYKEAGIYMAITIMGSIIVLYIGYGLGMTII